MPRWYWFQVYWDINALFSIIKCGLGCIYSSSTLLCLHCYTWKMEKIPHAGHTNGQSGIPNWQGGEKANEEQIVTIPLFFAKNKHKTVLLILKHYDRDLNHKKVSNTPTEITILRIIF